MTDPEVEHHWSIVRESALREWDARGEAVALSSDSIMMAMEEAICDYDEWENYYGAFDEQPEWTTRPPAPTEDERARVCEWNAKKRALWAIATQAERDRRDSCKWLDERGELNGRWRALWAEHARSRGNEFP